MTYLGQHLYHNPTTLKDGLAVYEPGYYWADETSDLYGPYPTQAEAQVAQAAYVESMIL